MKSLFLFAQIFCSLIIVICGQSDLTLTSLNASPQPAIAGSSITYTFQFQNLGPNSVSDATITVSFSASFATFASLSFTTLNFTASCNSASNPVVCNITGTITNQEVVSGNCVLNILSNAAGNSIITNITVTSPSDSNPNNNQLSSSSSIKGAGNADLAILVQTAGPPAKQPGDPIFAIVNATNFGPDLCTNAECTIQVPELNPDVPVILAPSGGNNHSVCEQPITTIPTYECMYGNLPVGGTFLLEMTYYLPLDLTGSVTVTFYCFCDQMDPNTTNNGGSVTANIASSSESDASSLSNFMDLID